MRHLDPTAAFTVLLASIFGAQLSTVIGPYAVIILAATTGAGWGLGRCKNAYIKEFERKNYPDEYRTGTPTFESRRSAR